MAGAAEEGVSVEQESASNKKTFVQRVTHIFTGGPKHTEPVAPVEPPKPVESESKRMERLEAYRKLCEEEAKNKEASGETEASKPVKYRSDHRKQDGNETH